ncbi:hypothetical protein Mapa_011187 [Marchantia paleacea]|nr:hypothetical protein Mapa_011187 [Marchantia paleacea]
MKATAHQHLRTFHDPGEQLAQNRSIQTPTPTPTMPARGTSKIKQAARGQRAQLSSSSACSWACASSLVFSPLLSVIQDPFPAHRCTCPVRL